MVDRVEAEEMFQKLESAQEELEELKDQRDNLLEANKKLVRVLVNMEDVLRREGVEIGEMDEFSYSFHKGWQDHQDSISIDDLDEDPEEQIRQLRKLLRGLETL